MSLRTTTVCAILRECLRVCVPTVVLCVWYPVSEETCMQTLVRICTTALVHERAHSVPDGVK